MTTIGVGYGDGELFVNGSYESIKRVQSIIIEGEESRIETLKLKEENEILKMQLESTLNMIKSSYTLDAVNLNNKSIDGFFDRKRKESIEEQAQLLEKAAEHVGQMRDVYSDRFSWQFRVRYYLGGLSRDIRGEGDE